MREPRSRADPWLVVGPGTGIVLGVSEASDVAVVGGGHNGLVAAALLARSGLGVRVLERDAVVGGAARTERPFARAPGLRASTGAYLFGLMPPELLRLLDVELPLRRRDPHYFLPMLDGDYLLLGSDEERNERQLARLFGPADVDAHRALQQELSELREDLAETWLQTPLSIEETAERYVRPERRRAFVALCRGSVGAYLERFGFRSEMLQAMYAVTDGFVGTCGGWDTPGTGMNFLLHNMGRLPGSDGTWMVVQGGMGTVSGRLERAARRAGAQVETGAEVVAIEAGGREHHRVHLEDGREVRARNIVVAADPFRMRRLLGPERLPVSYNERLDAYALPGTTLKVNLALRELPRFTCLPEDRGQHATTAHLFLDDGPILDSLQRAFAQAQRGELPERPSLEWLCHTPLDPALRDETGRHSAALFVQWVPYAPEGGWERHEERYVRHLLGLVDRFAPGFSELVEDVFTLHPQRIESHFGMTRGHIHHIDNRWGFADRLPYATPVPGVYAASAGCHPGGSVIGAAGHNAALELLRDLGRQPGWLA